MQDVAFGIHGLACALDAIALERRLRRVAGVARVYVNPANDTAYLSYDPDVVTPGRIAQAIEAEGLRCHRLVGGAIEGG